MLRKNLHPICHRDGTVTYWSVYHQVWVHRAAAVPDCELAAMREQERCRVTTALSRARGE